MKKETSVRLIARLSVLLSLIFVVSIIAARAQTTAFTYQGKLTDGAGAANGTYDLGFALFDAATGGTQIGAQLSRPAVNVSNGVFTVSLDFSANPFSSGANRFLEIAVKRPADADYTILTPRQQLTSSPFSIQSLSAKTSDGLSANCVACVTNAQINSVAGSKVTGTVSNATSATNFSGSLSGDVGGTQGATVIQPNAVTASKIASNQVVKSLNGLKDSVTLAGGSGINLTSSGNTLTFSLANTPLKRYVVGGLVGGYQYQVPHNLNSVDVVVQVYDQTGFLIFLRNVNNGTSDGYVKVIDANNILLGIYPAGTYRVVVIG